MGTERPTLAESARGSDGSSRLRQDFRRRAALIVLQLWVVSLCLFVGISALTFWRSWPVPNHLDYAAWESLAVAEARWGWVVAVCLTFIRAMVNVSCVFLLGYFVATTRARRPRVAAAIGLIVLANLSTQSLKALFAHVMPPHLAAIPSGHTTAGLSVACAATLLLADRRPALIVPAASFYAAFAPFAVVSARWHRPLDAVAAAVVVLAWTAALAWIQGLDARRVLRGARDVTIPAFAGALCLAVVAVLIGSRPSTKSTAHLVVGMAEHLVLPGLGALCVALAAGVARAANERDALR